MSNWIHALDALSHNSTTRIYRCFTQNFRQKEKIQGTTGSQASAAWHDAGSLCTSRHWRHLETTPSPSPCDCDTRYVEGWWMLSFSWDTVWGLIVKSTKSISEILATDIYTTVKRTKYSIWVNHRFHLPNLHETNSQSPWKSMVGSNMFKWFISFRGLLGPIFRGIFTLFVSGSVKCSWFLGGISVPKITDFFWKVIAGDEMTWQVIVSPKNVESFPFFIRQKTRQKPVWIRIPSLLYVSPKTPSL